MFVLVALHCIVSFRFKHFSSPDEDDYGNDGGDDDNGNDADDAGDGDDADAAGGDDDNGDCAEDNYGCRMPVAFCFLAWKKLATMRD